MKLIYKKCHLEELDQLVQISKTTFIDAFETHNAPEDFKSYIELAFGTTTLASELRNPHSSFYFVYWDKNLVGYFKLNMNDAQSDLKQKDSLELERIYILNNFQGKGLGEMILDKVKKLAAQTTKTFLWLGVWEQNVGAIKFYEKNGFVKFGRHPYYIGRDRQMDWLMRFDLIKV